ncbi:MAG: hypothetical protein RBS73_11025 [Prolixibacteraceae bacterium]|jgi:hypothetical protein|nr:hypothetical protein [Prolixibacteraceae bacterium]
MKENYLNIPIELCRYALSERCIKQVSLWIYLKSVTSGHFILHDELKQNILKVMGFKTSTTFKKHLKWLVEKKWITVNSIRESYRLISFSQLAGKLHFTNKQAAIFYPEMVHSIKGFCAGTVITYLANKNMRRLRRSASLKHEARMYYPYPHVTIYALSKFLSVPRSTAQRYKGIAKKNGFIKVVSMFDELIHNAKDYYFIKRVGGEPVKSYKKINNKIYEQRPDKIIPNVKIKYKKNGH